MKRTWKTSRISATWWKKFVRATKGMRATFLRSRRSPPQAAVRIHSNRTKMPKSEWWFYVIRKSRRNVSAKLSIPWFVMTNLTSKMPSTPDIVGTAMKSVQACPVASFASANPKRWHFGTKIPIPDWDLSVRLQAISVMDFFVLPWTTQYIVSFSEKYYLTEARNAESISNFRKKSRKFVFEENSPKLPSIWRIISYELCHKNVKILIRNFEIFCQKFVKVLMFTF